MASSPESSNQDGGLIGNVANTANRIMENETDVGAYIEGINNVANAYSQRKGLENDYMNILQSTLSSQMQTYNSNTRRIVDYSDMYANNAYIEQELKNELERTKKFINTLRNNIYTSKNQSQEYIYQTKQLQFWKLLTRLTGMVIVAILLSIRLNHYGLMTDASWMVMVVALSVGYILIVTYLVLRNSYRTRLDWTKFYWLNDPKKNDTNKCKT